MIEKQAVEKQAILVGLITSNQSEEQTQEYLDELAFLAQTDDFVTRKTFVQRAEQPNTNYYVGEGKIQEIKQFLLENCDINTIIFDDELSPRQLRNIEKTLNGDRPKDEGAVVVMDRTILILQIFLQRAKTSYAKTQVEMAH